MLGPLSLNSQFRSYISSILDDFLSEQNTKMLSISNLQKFLQTCGWNISNEENKILITKYDSKGEGFIAEDDLYQILAERQAVIDKDFNKVPEKNDKGQVLIIKDESDDLETIFKMLTQDTDGKISIKQLKKVMLDAGEKIMDHEWEQIEEILEISNEEEEVHYEEFLRAIFSL